MGEVEERALSMQPVLVEANQDLNDRLREEYWFFAN